MLKSEQQIAKMQCSAENSIGEINQSTGHFEVKQNFTETAGNTAEMEISSAVQTRAQVKKDKRPLVPLQHKRVDALNITSDVFEKYQREDPSLAKYWDLAEREG